MLFVHEVINLYPQLISVRKSFFFDEFGKGQVKMLEEKWPVGLTLIFVLKKNDAEILGDKSGE